MPPVFYKQLIFEDDFDGQRTDIGFIDFLLFCGKCVKDVLLDRSAEDLILLMEEFDLVLLFMWVLGCISCITSQFYLLMEGFMEWRVTLNFFLLANSRYTLL